MQENETRNLYKQVMEFTDSLINQWTHQFENTPKFPFSFHIDREGVLCLSNHGICPADEINLTSGEIDVEEFAFYTKARDCYVFYVEWPYNALIRVVHVMKNKRSLFICE